MMQNWSIYLVSAVGLAALVVLVVGANYAVKKLIGIANYFKLSSTFMGMTVLSVATSLPEITSHFTASVNILRGTLDYQTGSAIVLGANIGSDVVQQTLIMGIVILVAGNLYFRRYFLWKSMIPMIGTTIMCLILGWDGYYSALMERFCLAHFSPIPTIYIWTNASTTKKRTTSSILQNWLKTFQAMGVKC